MSQSIDPFEIHVSDAELSELKRRLAATRFPQQIPGTGWEYGADGDVVRELVRYWAEDFDWRAQETALNAFPQFTSEVGDQRIHFIHARSRHAGATPLLLLHGWPGSVVEFMDVIGPLVEPESHGGAAEDAFHVVAPSLPGYGFSEATKTRGYDCHRIAEDFATLMARLGYDDYGVEGGDWGAIVGNNLAILDADHVRGYHTTMPLAFPPADGPGDLSESEQQALADLEAFEREETGYQKIQGTKPQTLGVGLTDSPAGLCAWIAEKFHAWTDCDGVIENAVSRDRLLANIMLYWVSGNITPSTRLYYETFRSARVGVLGNRVEVPTGVARFPREIMRFPRSWVEKHYNVTHWSEMTRGGHFAAMEQPAAFVEDLRAFFRTLR